MIAKEVAQRNRTRLVALVGNPNTGKTTLFNELTGFRQRVGNYPGVTVEKKSGPLHGPDGQRAAEILDLPGTYSLSARSRDEMVVTDVLLGRVDGTPRPDLIVAVVDATNLKRNLFLTTQLMEMGLPVVVALNMSDAAEQDGIHIDAVQFSQRLGVPVVKTSAVKGEGIDALRRLILGNLDAPAPECDLAMPELVEQQLAEFQRELIAGNGRHSDVVPPRPALLQVLLESGGYAERHLAEVFGQASLFNLHQRRQRLVEGGFSLTDVEAHARFAWIRNALAGIKTDGGRHVRRMSDRVDRVLTHRVAGTLVFALLMAVVFQGIYTWAAPIMNGINGLVGGLGAMLESALPAGALRSLVTNGVIAGVGAVVVFLPQILMLFLFIGILEDCGYLARGAMLLDRVMCVFGLNGKAFIPLLSSFACAVPGIMATRTIENRADRLVTIAVAPLMSCSARLPVYTLLIAAFIPDDRFAGGWLGLQGLVLFAMYMVGVLVAIPVAMLLRRGLTRERRQPFMMELPAYRWPQWKTILFRLYERGREFLVRAGTIIFAVSILIWVIGYYPRPASIATTYDQKRQALIESHGDGAFIAAPADGADELHVALNEIDREESGEFLRASLLGRLGKAIEPVVEPLGWDWRIGMAAVASFPAREVVIATLGTIYNMGGDVNEDSPDLRSALAAAKWPDGRPVYTIPVALSLMVFFALCCQCVSTLAVIKRETNSWRWPVFTFTYMTVLAYVGAFAIYRATGWMMG